MKKVKSNPIEQLMSQLLCLEQTLEEGKDLDMSETSIRLFVFLFQILIDKKTAGMT